MPFHYLLSLTIHSLLLKSIQLSILSELKERDLSFTTQGFVHAVSSTCTISSLWYQNPVHPQSRAQQSFIAYYYRPRNWISVKNLDSGVRLDSNPSFGTFQPRDPWQVTYLYNTPRLCFLIYKMEVITFCTALL